MNFEQPQKEQEGINQDKEYVKNILEEILMDNSNPSVRRLLEFEEKRESLPMEISRKDIRRGLVQRFSPLVEKRRNDFANEINIEEKVKNSIKKGLMAALKTAAEKLP